MSYKIVVFMAAVPEESLLQEGKQPVRLETRNRTVTLVPAAICDVDTGVDVESMKGKVCEKIDKLAAASRTPREEQPSSDPKVLRGRVAPQPGIPGLPGVGGLPQVRGFGRKSK